ncbi:hypothetical protein BGX29_004722, partial [Mortierella sp. GBA35]
THLMVRFTYDEHTTSGSDDDEFEMAQDATPPLAQVEQVLMAEQLKSTMAAMARYTQQTPSIQQSPPVDTQSSITPPIQSATPAIHPPVNPPILPSIQPSAQQSILTPQTYTSRWDDPNRPAPEFPSRIETFTGNEINFDLDEYMSDIELQFTVKNWPPNKKVSSFVGLLRSGARQWANAYLLATIPTEVTDWIRFKAAFCERWRSSHLTTNLRAEIQALKRNPNETLSAFSSKYLALANRIHDR